MKMKNVKITVISNKSSTYFLPILNALVNFKFLHLLRNSYVANNEEEGAFSVLYKWSGKPDFTSYEEELMGHTLFVGHEDYGDHVLYKFKLPENAQKLMKLFVQGKYSEYPNEVKVQIRDFVQLRGFSNYDRIYRIMQKDDELRKQMESELRTPISPNAELSSPPDMDAENFSNSLEYINLEDNNPEFD